MIGIVILGLGMVLVATMFPVAWQRTRRMSEYTVSRTVADSTRAAIRSLLRVTGPDADTNHTSLMGDLLFFEDASAVDYDRPISACGGWPSDPWVHPLHLENIRVDKPQNRGFIPEDLWQLQDSLGNLQRALNDPDLDPDVIRSSFFTPQLRFAQRVYPPLRPRKNVDKKGLFQGEDASWDEALGTRRFALGIFHRLREPLSTFAVLQTLRETRLFDVYVVTLRRPQPAARYARQDPTTAPNLCNLNNAPVAPAPLPPENDVLLPVPWRVQVEFRGTIPPAAEATGIPAEVHVPPKDLNASPDVKAMIVQMFPPGTRWIDEVSGQVYRVVKRRLADRAGTEAVLTLDREVVLEDLDHPVFNGFPSLCDPNAPGVLAPCERVRTVWVYPPAVEPRAPDEALLVFDGPTPVVDIQVETLVLTPQR
ncbi:MAG: hypothetical protein D6788_06555 [Planctomycetota bacterium]|nr:MAG: hypothetical protein D6788_06555 [Planctomycetota bacterium]